MKYLIVFAMVLGVLLSGCCGTGQDIVNMNQNIMNYSSNAIHQTLLDCKPGTYITISAPAGNVSGVPISVTRKFEFKGWQGDSCVLESIDVTCSYTRSEVENLNPWEAMYFLQERCMNQNK